MLDTIINIGISILLNDMVLIHTISIIGKDMMIIIPMSTSWHTMQGNQFIRVMERLITLGIRTIDIATEQATI